MHIVDQVLGFNEADGLEHDLTAQASHILEETDISTVLSTIHVDEFNDFFAGKCVLFGLIVYLEKKMIIIH